MEQMIIISIPKGIFVLIVLVLFFVVFSIIPGLFIELCERDLRRFLIRNRKNEKLITNIGNADEKALKLIICLLEEYELTPLGHIRYNWWKRKK